MGLDSVEIILRTEDTFGVELPDDECSHVITVGDLYRLVLRKLNLPYAAASEIEGAPGVHIGRNRMHAQFPSLYEWSTPDVWVTLKAIIEDQLQVDLDDIRESASFINDLGCD